MLYVFKWNMCDVYSWYVVCDIHVHMWLICVWCLLHLSTVMVVICYVYVVLVYVKCGTYRYMICVVIVVWATLVYGVHLCVLWYGVYSWFMYMCVHTFEDMTVIRQDSPFLYAICDEFKTKC